MAEQLAMVVAPPAEWPFEFFRSQLHSLEDVTKEVTEAYKECLTWGSGALPPSVFQLCDVLEDYFYKTIVHRAKELHDVVLILWGFRTSLWEGYQDSGYESFSAYINDMEEGGIYLRDSIEWVFFRNDVERALDMLGLSHVKECDDSGAYAEFEPYSDEPPFLPADAIGHPPITEVW